MGALLLVLLVPALPMAPRDELVQIDPALVENVPAPAVPPLDFVVIVAQPLEPVLGVNELVDATVEQFPKEFRLRRVVCPHLLHFFSCVIVTLLLNSGGQPDPVQLLDQIPHGLDVL